MPLDPNRDEDAEPRHDPSDGPLPDSSSTDRRSENADGGPGSDLTSTNTEQLLARARAGSNAVWQVFFDRYKDFLVYHIRVKMPEFARRQFDAEDVLQSAFVAAWQNILRFEYQGEGSFRRYLRKTVLNKFLNELKRAESRGRHHSVEEDQLTPGSPADTDRGATDPAQILSREEFLEHALEKLCELDEDDQELLGMRFYESMTWTDMADVLGCDRETAKQRFLRALKRLQLRIDRAAAEELA